MSADPHAAVIARIRSLGEQLGDIEEELMAAGYREAATALDFALDDIESAIRSLEAA